MFRLLRHALAARRELRRQRRIKRVPLGEVVADTLVRVVGTARPLGPVLEAPLSGRICVCHAVVVYDWHRDGSVRVIATPQDRSPFVLADGDHRAVVDPARAQMSALFDFETSIAPTEPRTRAKLEALGIGDRDFSATTLLELSEAIIELDELIAVVGTAQLEPDTDAMPASYRDGDLPIRLRLFPATISDDPRMLA